MVYTLFYRNGRVAQTITGSFEVVIAPTLMYWEGFHYEGEYDDSYYFFDGEPIKRPDNTTYLDGLVLRDVPPDSTILIDGAEYPCPDGGDVSLNFSLRGKYSVMVLSFPHLDKEFTIDYQP